MPWAAVSLSEGGASADVALIDTGIIFEDRAPARPIREGGAT